MDISYNKVKYLNYISLLFEDKGELYYRVNKKNGISGVLADFGIFFSNVWYNHNLGSKSAKFRTLHFSLNYTYT